MFLPLLSLCFNILCFIKSFVIAFVHFLQPLPCSAVYNTTYHLTILDNKVPLIYPGLPLKGLSTGEEEIRCTSIPDTTQQA